MEFNKKMRIDIKKSFDKGLYVAATPIGNLGDISRRALDLFASADFIICEDKRVSGNFFHIMKLKLR
jgi:16S rRNA (cytidine1402-2'-O)-methyltransferase